MNPLPNWGPGTKAKVAQGQGKKKKGDVPEKRVAEDGDAAGPSKKAKVEGAEVVDEEEGVNA
jgi:hypothetical protein